MKNYKKLSDSKLSSIQGGVAPIIIAGAIFLAKDAWDHYDQIAAGFKKGWNGGRR